MTIVTVVEETIGARRYQVLQTASEALTIRLENIQGTNREEVWRRVCERLDELLRNHRPPRSRSY